MKNIHYNQIFRLHVGSYISYLALRWLNEKNCPNNQDLCNLFQNIHQVSQQCFPKALKHSLSNEIKNKVKEVDSKFEKLAHKIIQITDVHEKTLNIVGLLECACLFQQDIYVVDKFVNWGKLYKLTRSVLDDYFLPQYPLAEEIGNDWYYETFLGNLNYKIYTLLE